MNSQIMHHPTHHAHGKLVDCYQPKSFCRSPEMTICQGFDFLARMLNRFSLPQLCGCHPHYRSCKHHHHLHHSHQARLHTNIKLLGQLGERRVVKFLVENNRPREETIVFHARSWLDAFGHDLEVTNIEFSPAQVELQSGEAVSVQAMIELAKPFEADMAYFTEFVLEGCTAQPISVGMYIPPEGFFAHYAICDPCRCRHGRFVELCVDPCAPLCGCEDPHHHWYDSCHCTWHYLPSRLIASG